MSIKSFKAKTGGGKDTKAEGVRMCWVVFPRQWEGVMGVIMIKVYCILYEIVKE